MFGHCARSWPSGCQEIGHHRRDHSNPEFASDFVLEVIDCSTRLFELAQYRFCFRQEGFSELSQPHAAAEPKKKGSPDFGFQLLNLLG
jgi:hypothetical protein